LGIFLSDSDPFFYLDFHVANRLRLEVRYLALTVFFKIKQGAISEETIFKIQPFRNKNSL
jgi:hypothetical protein